MTDKQALRQLATDAHELGIINRYTKGIEANKRFIAAATPLTVLALLDELEAKDKQIAELVGGRQNLQRTMGVYVHAYEEAKEQIAKDVEIKTRLCLESNSLFDRLRAAEKRIVELEASHSKLRETMAAIHNTIRMDGGYTPLAAILNAAKRAYEESAAAGIGKGE